MSTAIILKTVVIWFLMVILAIANGVLRERILNPNTGPVIGLPLSGITLSALVFLVIYLTLPFFGTNSAKTYLLIGLQLVMMTLAFEFLAGHYVAGKSWKSLLQVFNVLKGDLFLLVLLTSLLAPYLGAKLRMYLP